MGGKHENMQAWTPEEDQIILTLVQIEGPKWGRIVQRLPGRSAQSVRKRWMRIEKGRKLREQGIESGRRCGACGIGKRGHVCKAMLGGDPKVRVDPVVTAGAVTLMPPMPMASLPEETRRQERGGGLMLMSSLLGNLRSDAAGLAPSAPPSEKPPLTADEALRQAEAEGLTFLRSQEPSGTGFQGVQFIRNRVKPYQARVPHGGKSDKQVFLGYFVTAEEAALAVARAGFWHWVSAKSIQIFNAGAAASVPEPAAADNLAVDDAIEAMGASQGGGRVWFRATVLQLRARHPPILVKYTATLEGETNRLGLPSPMKAYLNADDVRRSACNGSGAGSSENEEDDINMEGNYE